MLMKVTGKSEIGTGEFKLNLKIPFVYLDSNDYTISVRRISFICKKDPGKAFFTLHSSAVDRNLLNPDQEIYFVYNRGSSFINAIPPTPFVYKVQIKDIHTSEFSIRTSSTIRDNSLENFEVILEILRDARIQ